MNFKFSDYLKRKLATPQTQPRARSFNDAVMDAVHSQGSPPIMKPLFAVSTNVGTHTCTGAPMSLRPADGPVYFPDGVVVQKKRLPRFG